MKLYVWQNVLQDWSCGLVVAIAPDLETALAKAYEQIGYPLTFAPDDLTVFDNLDTEFFAYVAGGR